MTTRPSYHYPLLVGFLLLLSISPLDACTNFLITKGAAVDNANMVFYSADSHTLYGYLSHYPAGFHETGEQREIYDWDSQQYLGAIPEAHQTYNVVGNVNEWGLAIGESTWGGIPELSSQPAAVLDYGSLIYIALQRCKTARDAIHVFAALVEEWGYASEGESFSIVDPDEVWFMEIIGKGAYEKGAVWVAKLLPNGSISAHANQARITTFTIGGSHDTKHSPDVISFAKKIGRYPADAPDFAFSFSDVYNPVNFESARGCEARVWDFLHRHTDMTAYVDYVSGTNLSNRMPLFVEPDRKLNITTVMHQMRSHYEDTVFQFDQDVGAQGFNLPYRWRPLTWTSQGQAYFNERSIATQQTAFNFLAISRSNVPDPIKALLLFGVDDTSLSVLTPIYGGVSEVPESWKPGNIMKFSFQSAFWVFNLVANFAYSRFSAIYPDIVALREGIDQAHLTVVQDTDKSFVELWEGGQEEEALTLINKVCVKTAEDLVATWLNFFQELFVRYMDGNVKYLSKDPQQPLPKVHQPGYPQPFYDIIAEETGDRYKVPSSSSLMREEGYEATARRRSSRKLSMKGM